MKAHRDSGDDPAIIEICRTAAEIGIRRRGKNLSREQLIELCSDLFAEQARLRTPAITFLVKLFCKIHNFFFGLLVHMQNFRDFLFYLHHIDYRFNQVRVGCQILSFHYILRIRKIA